jgi:hypothetical protein
MAEPDVFERRVADALLAYAGEMPTRVDAAAVADRAAGERVRPWARIPALRLGTLPRFAWILVVATLLALAGGIVLVGSGLLDRPRLLNVVVNPTITTVAPTQGQSSTVVAGFDGYTWALDNGHLVRLDSVGGTTDFGSEVGYRAYRLAPARGGGVWLYGQRHLWRFDGVLRGEALRAPLEDGSLDAVIDAADGTMWASSEDGVFRWDGRTWSSVPRPRPDVAAGPMTLDGSGSLWVSEMRYPGPTAEGISRFDGTKWTHYTETGAGTSLPIVTGIAADAQGAVWAGLAGWDSTDAGGLVRFDGSTWTTIPQGDLGASATASWAPVVGPAGDVWAVTTSAQGPMRVARYDGRTWTSWGPANGLPGPDAIGYSAASLAVTANGAVAGTHAGVYRLVGDRWERVWPADEVVAVPLLDMLGVSAAEAWGLWVGAWGNDTSELWHFQGDAVSHETVGEATPAVRDLALAPDGTLWAATDGGVAARVDGNWTIVDEQPALGVAVASDGTVWVGGKGATAWTVRPAGAGWEVREVPDAATGGSTPTEIASWKLGPTMAVDRAGHLWVSGGNQGWIDTPGLQRFGGGRWEAMRPVEDASATVFGNVVAAPDGAVWVTIDTTSANGNCCPPADPAAQVARFDGRRWEVFGTADGLPSDNVGLSLAIGPDGAAWLSTPRGLFRYDGQRWSPVLEGEAYGRLSAAPDGTLWFSGYSGVGRISEPTR